MYIAENDAPRIILCDTPTGCTCGAPASTPRGMHHDDCAIRGRVIPPAEGRAEAAS